MCCIGCPPQRANTPTGWFFKEVSFLNRKGGPTLRCPQSWNKVLTKSCYFDLANSRASETDDISRTFTKI